ncbi:MAG: zinc metalloprotease HtpX [Deltaproteobacteria bacterium]|nr:zinc metalloprotease HtpX [Deltaproteobacteria bacterium]
MANSIKTVLLLGLMSGIILFLGQVAGGKEGLVISLGIAVLMNFIAYWFSDKIVLFSSGAQQVSPTDAPKLHSIVEQLAYSANIPKPRVYIIDTPMPNAFATGRNPKHSAVAVTTGLMDLLDEHELRGVIAHELAHIKNRDILISTVAATLAAAITVFVRIIAWGFMAAGSSRDNDRGGGANAVLGLLMIIIAPLLALIIQMWISRTREYQADESGAKIAGTPHGLASALAKIAGFSKRLPISPNPATAHMYIYSPLSGESILSIFSTHPPVEERIKRLRAMTI